MQNNNLQESVVFTKNQAATYLSISEAELHEKAIPYIKYPDVEQIFYHRRYLDEYKVKFGKQ